MVRLNVWPSSSRAHKAAGALYMSEMSATGSASKLNTAGAKYGTGYCDAQCPKNNFVGDLVRLRVP
jgi:cellulose 1,4-beta-cellobiosidase